MVAATTAIFPNFQNLPRELRDQIWHDSMPEKDKPALFPWKKGCWCPRHLQKHEPQWEPNEDLNLILETCYGLLDHVQVEVPLFFVSWEARRIALAWMRKQDITLRFRKDKQCWVFTRPFDPMMDTVYIAKDKIYEFFVEPQDRMFEPDLHDRSASIYPYLRRVAVPPGLFQDDVSELFDWYSLLQEMSVVVGPQPCWDNYDRQRVQGQRWEVKDTQGGVFVYNHSHRRFDLHDGDKAVGGEALDRQIEEACEYFSGMVADNKGERFEIRKVIAVMS
ncbi:uncharacterized protein APUU_60035S [Aspergillus puulaauensis]|uniref:2EXR domain-containing protein n=1 Tax=Aspergillus puulaauensis TaxID=1220207 RepID=A0A7R7XTB3_9EURO|nr:uncharacterized protein APUU_60035S [Aspergillus puulaauensis]BCS26987.1 hypothetical protein APUU_60035S [Aspergillus puulaauensis]